MFIHIGPIGLIIIGMVIIAALQYAYWQRSQYQRYLRFYRRITRDLNIFVLNYNIRRDEVRLSPSLARLLGLPRLLTQYSSWCRAAGDDPRDSRYILVRCLQAYDDDRPYRVDCQNCGVRWFQLHSYMFRSRNRWAQNVIGVFTDVTDQFQTESQLTAKAQIDELTRLHNSSATRAYLEANVGRAGRSAFIIIDIDYFKTVNDTYGHQVGDRVLLTVADAMRAVLQGRGYLGRMGGDEFCCYLSSLSASEDLYDLCARLNRSVTRSCQSGELHLQVTVSVGAAVLPAGTSFAKAYQGADTALYRAKEQGRNSYAVVYLPLLDEKKGEDAHAESAQTADT